MKSWNEIRKAATAFSKRWKNAYDEKAQAQSFLKEFFAVFGVDTVVFNAFEHRVKFTDGSQGYADGSTVTYTHTPDGKPLRETKPGGAWQENLYDASRQIVGVVSSDGALDATMTRDEFGNVTSESNAVSFVEYNLDDHGYATNEVQTVECVFASFSREFDAYGRITRFARVGGESVGIEYSAVDGSLAVVSNISVNAMYAFTDDRLDAGYSLAVRGGGLFNRSLIRDTYRRGNVVAVTNIVGAFVDGLTYSYDALNRPISRNAYTFSYNERGEVVFSRRDAENAEDTYAYDDIGNLLYSSDNFATNTYISNNRNQYTSILRDSVLQQETSYDIDGNMTRYVDWTYAYDSGNRLLSVSSNNAIVASFAYDTHGRRVKKVAADGTHRYFYDGWLLVYEHIIRPDNTTNEIDYVWGKDISGSRDGAAGIGGLLYLTISNSSTPNSSTQQLYIPFYDAYGNILCYCDAQGNVVANYTYDAFGNIVSQSGTMSDDFAFRFSTEYYDTETCLYYYGYRFFKPQIMRWLTEDPIGVAGGKNLYAFCCNNSIDSFDVLGATAVRINVGTEVKDTPRGYLNFIKIDAIVIEPPKNGGKLNFVQLKKSPYKDWELDIQGTPGPYYYKLFDVKNYTRKNADGNDIVTLYDAPGGFLDKVDFFTAVVEVNRSCCAGKHRYGFPIIKCYDKVKVISSVSWSFDPKASGFYQYSGKPDNFIKRSLMIPTMQQLINLSTWNTELCPTTKVEVQNNGYGH